MKKIKIIFTILTVVSLVSCQKYLEKEPKVQTDIQTADQLDDLLNNPTGGPTWAYDGSNATAAYSTDDTEIPLALYQNNPTASAVSIADLYYYTFDVTNIVGASSDLLWNGEYKKIFTANVILATVDNVTGSEAQKNRIKADAYFARAYSYWNLANYYCMPYAAANMQTQGLPLKKTTDYAESLNRATLQATYDFINSDIAQAQSLVTGADVQASARWRITKPAIDAFLSRYYLFTGDYTQSLKYSNSALTSSVAQLVDYNTIAAGSTATYTNPAATLKFTVLNDWAASQFLQWNEFYYTRFTYLNTQFFVPSTNLVSLYDTQNDLRYQYFMIANGGRRFAVITPATYRYDVFNDGRYLPTGPTVAEVLLNKAEAAARTGDVTTAMTAVNLLRAKRYKNYVALSATDKTDALAKVLLERRKELPFSFRWWDIRRFSVNDEPTDDVVVSHVFFKMGVGTVDQTSTQTYTLPLKSTRYMVPINGIEISASQGQIQQNNY